MSDHVLWASRCGHWRIVRLPYGSLAVEHKEASWSTWTRVYPYQEGNLRIDAFEAMMHALAAAKSETLDAARFARNYPQSLIDAGWVPRECMVESFPVGPQTYETIINLRDYHDSAIRNWLASRAAAGEKA